MYGILRWARVRALAVLATVAALGVWASSASAFTVTTVTGEHMSEPGIVVSPDGTTIYIDGPEGFLSNLPGSPSPVFRSENAGATWTKTAFSLRANLPGGGDSDVAVDPATGALYMTDLWLGDSTVSTSTDKGDSWLANPLQGIPVQDRQWVASTGNGVVYHLVHQIPLGLIVSKGNGLVYPITTIAATPVDQTGCVCPPGNLIAQSGGGGLLGTNDHVGFVYATSSGGVKFAGSTNSGLTFTNVDVQPASSNTTNNSFPVVANAGGNRLVAVWTNTQGGQSSIGFSESTDWGATWSTPKTIVSGGASIYPWVAASGSKIAVSLYHTSTAGTADTVPAGTQWFETYLESTDGGATFSAPVTVDPTPAKSGPICTAGTGCSANRELGDFQSVALDKLGNALPTWVHSIDGTSTEVRFAHQ